MEIRVNLKELIKNVGAYKVLKWFVDEGKEVKEGEPLVEVETDKVAVLVESPCDGRVKEVLVEEGETVNPEEPMCVLEVEG